MNSSRKNTSIAFTAVSIVLLLAAWTTAQSVSTRQGTPPRAPINTLESVLKALDTASPKVKSVVADAESRKYTKVVDDTSVERGQLFYRKAKNAPELVLNIQQPAPKEFIYRNNTGWMYQPAIHQVQKYDLRRNKSLVEQFFLLGLGGGGHSLTRAFNVKYAGTETIDGVAMPKLVLTPRDPQFARNITSVELWFDPRLWVAAQQKFNQPSGDYQMLHYSHIQLNAKIPGSRFDTNFPGATVVTPHA
jgi:outer membrane lipoprotein-sorting protein